MRARPAPSFLVTPVVAGEVWTRCGRVGVPHAKRPLDQKELRRWIETASAGKHVLEGAARVTIVADREADLFALWALVLNRASMCWAGFTTIEAWSAAAP